jgi:hypothetical protein
MNTKQDINVGYEVFTAVSTKMAVFWAVAPCSLVEVYQRFRGPAASSSGRHLLKSSMCFTTEYNEEAMGNSPQTFHSLCEDGWTNACLERNSLLMQVITSIFSRDMFD